MNEDKTELERKIRQILTDLEGVRENLLTLSDDIWLNIDHNDTQAMEEGVNFKRLYNEKLVSFDRLVSDLSGLVQNFTKVPVEDDHDDEPDWQDTEVNERIIRDLDRTTPHSLDEDFRYKRPYGIIFQGKAYQNLVTWNRVYRIICRDLMSNDPEHFKQKTSTRAFISSRGNKDFSDESSELRKPMELVEGFYAEANLSANSIRDRIRRLLDTFGIPKDDCKIYLREDRNAEN